MCQISANACLAHQDMALLKGLDKRNLKHSPPKDQLSNSRGTGIWDLGHSPIRVDKIFRVLQDYPVRKAAKELLKGLTKRFKLNYVGPRLGSFSNLVSANEHKAQLEEKINKKVDAGRIMGQISNTPLPNIHIPKRFSSKIKWRLEDYHTSVLPSFSWYQCIYRSLIMFSKIFIF